MYYIILFKLYYSCKAPRKTRGWCELFQGCTVIVIIIIITIICK